jgi:hypothetical protein
MFGITTALEILVKLEHAIMCSRKKLELKL